MGHSFRSLRYSSSIAPATVAPTAGEPRCLDPDLVRHIRPILLTNAHSGRMARAIASGRHTTVCDYARAVAGHYQAWQPTVQRLVVGRDEALWAELFTQLQGIGRYYLRYAEPLLLDGLEATTAVCAEDTALAILRRHYPFDCDFLAWSFATLRTLCRRKLYQLCHTTDLLGHCQARVDDSEAWAKMASAPDMPDDRLADLSWATARLATSNRRVFARLRYFEGLSYEQIAVAMGKSIGALYKLNSDTLANYRDLLGQLDAATQGYSHELEQRLAG